MALTELQYEMLGGDVGCEHIFRNLTLTQSFGSGGSYRGRGHPGNVKKAKLLVPKVRPNYRGRWIKGVDVRCEHEHEQRKVMVSMAVVSEVVVG